MTTQIEVNRVANSRINEVDFANIQFGRIFSDHQFIADYDNGKWMNPRIVPYGNISISPAISAIHYGQSIFEGMKAYKDSSGTPQLFRPLDNCKRLNYSARRMGMPELPQELFLESLSELIRTDSQWIPTTPGSALYLRPFMFATDDFIGVRPSSTYKFIIFSCPVNAYYNVPLKVKAETHFIRAAPGGAGAAKCAGNYGAVMRPSMEAQKQGYHQVLWLDSLEHRYLEETGTTNIFVRIGDTLITPALTGETILAGITRDSVIQLARSWNIKVEERKISIDELYAANDRGDLKEMFVAGTAATIAKIELVHYNGKDLSLGNPDNWEWCQRLKTELESIKTGNSADQFNWVYKIR